MKLKCANLLARKQLSYSVLREEQGGWYPFDREFQYPTGLEGYPPVARGDEAHRCGMKSLVPKAW